MPSVGFKPTIPAGERQQTYALDRAATGTSKTATFMYRSIRTSRSPEPYVKVLENSEAQVPRRPCGTRGPIGGNWTQNVENAKLRCVFFSGCVTFSPWQTELFWIPVISGNNFANNYRIPRISSCGDFSRCFTQCGESNIRWRSASETQSIALRQLSKWTLHSS